MRTKVPFAVAEAIIHARVSIRPVHQRNAISALRHWHRIYIHSGCACRRGGWNESSCKTTPRHDKKDVERVNKREAAACRPWLEAEIKVVRPRLIVCLGATAAQSLLGNKFRLTAHRAEVITDTGWAPALLATVHPASLLRIPDGASRHQAMKAFHSDFVLIARTLKKESN